MGRKIIWRYFSLFLILSTACSITGDIGGQDEESTDLIPFEGETTPPELPRDSIEVMLDRVEAGELTLEEGVVENLKLMAGEIAYEELYGDETLRLESGWGLTLLAQEVLANSNDQEAKDEILRLLNILAPLQDNLDLYAAPEEEFAAASPQLAALSLYSPPSQSVLCASVWSEGFPRTFEDPPVCLLYRSFSFGGHEYRVYYPEEKRLDSNYMRHVDAATAGLKDSVEKLSPFAEVPDINLGFTLLPSSSAASALAGATIPGVGEEVFRDVACPMMVFPASIGGDLDELKFTIAHEVFHCISAFRKGYTGYSEAAWYQEGIAEYFANVVYPAMNFEHIRIAEFDNHSAFTWLMEMNYENAVFFQYLENRFDANYILSLHDAMPAWDPLSDQASALAGFDDMQTIFHEFARAYFTRGINDTGGGTLPTNIYVTPENVFEIGEGRALDLSASAFMLARFELVFDEGVEYEVAKETGGDEGRNAWREREDTAFGEIPDSFRSSCNERPSYLLILTTAPPGATQTSQTELDIEFTAGEEGKMDCCLVGTWEQPAGEIRANLETIMSGSGMNIQNVSGRLVLSITEEHTMSFFPEGYNVELRDPDGEIITGSVVGLNTSTFTIPAEGQIAPENDSPYFIVTITTPEGGGSFSLDASGLRSPFTAGSTYSYTCDERTLTASTEGQAPFASATFNRVSPIPATPPSPEEFPEPSDGGPGGIPDISVSSDCLLISANDFSAGGSTIGWRLNNATDETVEISAVSLDWPSSNGNLDEISLNGSPLWAGSESFSPARIEGPWEADRTISVGADAELAFDFSGEPVEASPYILVVDFTNGCILSDVQ